MSTGQLVTLAIVALIGFWVVGAYNRLVALRNAIGTAWQQVQDALARRGEAVAPLVTALRGPMGSEAASLDALLAAQSQVAAAADALGARPVLAELAGALVRAESLMASASSRLLALLEQHPEVAADDGVAPQVAALREIEPRLAFARQLFNEAVQRYNDAVRQFPTRLLARGFGFGTAGRI